MAPLTALEATAPLQIPDRTERTLNIPRYHPVTLTSYATSSETNGPCLASPISRRLDDIVGLHRLSVAFVPLLLRT